MKLKLKKNETKIEKFEKYNSKTYPKKLKENGKLHETKFSCNLSQHIKLVWSTLKGYNQYNHHSEIVTPLTECIIFDWWLIIFIWLFLMIQFNSIIALFDSMIALKKSSSDLNQHINWFHRPIKLITNIIIILRLHQYDWYQFLLCLVLYYSIQFNQLNYLIQL